MDQIPALIIVIPLLAAAICAALPNNRLPWLLATASSWAVLAAAALLLQQVLGAGVVVYDLGGWPAPIGIEYRVDALNALVIMVVAIIGAVVLPFAGRSVAHEIRRHQISLFYSLFLLCYTGLLGIAITGDIFNIFVFLEISSLSSYALISLGTDRRALTAAYQYLIMGTIGATFFLIGVGMLYAMTGTLNLADLSERLPAVADTRTVLTGFAFIVAGIGLKAAVFPVHLWLPNAYTHAPSAVSAFIAATATKVAVYALARMLFTVFGVEYSFGQLPLQPILVTLAIAGILVTSLMAAWQADAKKLLAYSSVAQIGYMVMGLALATSAGVAAALTHLFNHALMKGALFLTLGAVAYRVGSTGIHAMRGLGYAMPWTMGAFVIGGLSLVGVPLTAGFISKWYLILAALEIGWWWLALVVLLASIIALVYVWRVVEAAYFREPDAPAGDVREAPLALLVPTWTLALANIWFGLDTRLTAGLATTAANNLLGGTP
jgi:multicomponent Na+:H+ antiporter subunit D